MESEPPGQGQGRSQGQGQGEGQRRRLGASRAIRLAAAVAAVIVIIAAVELIHHQGRAGRPWWSETGVSSCGTPVLARVHGHRLYLGSCAGLLTVPAKRITLRVGQQVDIHMLQEQARTSGQLIPVYPLPRTSRPSILTRTWISADRADASYRAVHQGQAILASWARCLSGSGSSEKTGRCPVLTVTVVP